MIGQIQYGVLGLSLTKINDVIRRPIMDDSGTDYCFTETSVDCICTLNPRATSFASLAGNVPQAGAAFAGRTDRILFDYLSNPADPTTGRRKTLKMWAFDADGSRVTYLESPPPGGGRVQLPTDAKNGPKCIVFGISGADVHGAKTWVLHLRFITWINNCLDSISPILSHRWERNVDYDEQYRAIATTRGTVVFNVGRLWQGGFSPDHFRSQFFQPPADNMKRQHVNVQIASDNCTASYTVVDSEQFYNVGNNSPATNVEATLQNWYEQGSAGAAIAQTAPTAYSNLATSAANALMPWGIATSLYGAWSNVTTLTGNLQATLPKYYAKISVRAHGARNSARRDLASLCFAIAFSRLGHPRYFSLANKTEMVVVQQLHNNFVELSMTIRWMDQMIVQLAGIGGPPGTVAATLGMLINNDNGRRYFSSYFISQDRQDDPLGNNTYTRPPDGLPPTPLGEGREPFRAGAPLLSQKPIGNHPMNSDTTMTEAKHNRGVGYMKVLLTQALLGQCPNLASVPNWDGEAARGGQPAPIVPPVRVPLLPRS